MQLKKKKESFDLQTKIWTNKKHLIQLKLLICFAVTFLLGLAPSIAADVAYGSKPQINISVSDITESLHWLYQSSLLVLLLH